MIGYFKKVKICCALAGAAAVLAGQKLMESDTVKKTAVDLAAAGIKAVDGAKAFFKDIFDEANEKVESDKAAKAEETVSEAAPADDSSDSDDNSDNDDSGFAF